MSLLMFCAELVITSLCVLNVLSTQSIRIIQLMSLLFKMKIVVTTSDS